MSNGKPTGMRMKRAVLLLTVLVAAASLNITDGCAQGRSEVRSGTSRPPAFNQAQFDRTFTHRTAAANGVTLHYVIGGRGEPVVLLHGFPQTWREWRRVMPALAERYTVIAVDLRGAGDSGRPPSGYDKRTMAEDIYQLLRQLNFARINLVGHDIGLMVAYAYASAHPEAVNKLVLIDAPLPGTQAFDRIARDPRAWHFGFNADIELATQLVAGRERLYITSFFNKLAGNHSALTPDDINEYVRAYSRPGAMRAAFEWYRAFPVDAEHNSANARTRLRMPVLAMNGGPAGQGQTESYVAVMMRELAENVEGAVIEGAGHWLPEEQPEELARRLRQFLGG